MFKCKLPKVFEVRISNIHINNMFYIAYIKMFPLNYSIKCSYKYMTYFH